MIFTGAGGEAVASSAIDDLLAAGIITREDMSMLFWKAAGELKSIQRRISLADCFALTLTDKARGTLFTTDHHELDNLAAAREYRIQFIR